MEKYDKHIQSKVREDRPKVRAVNRRVFIRLSTLIGVSLPLVVTLTPNEAMAQGSGEGSG